MARLRPSPRSLVAPAAIAALAVLLRLVTGPGLVNYDTLYTLVWGRDVAHGRAPDLDAPLVPTAHPLQTVVAAILSPLSSAGDTIHGHTAEQVVLWLAFLALATVGWLVYRLGATWFHPAVGIAAAVLFLSRRSVLDFGARAYVDIPFLALVLGAALVASKKPRSGAPVLLLLAAAGLLRPEAWLFSVAYVAWLREPRLLAYAAIGPLGWALYDLVLTGNPLDSFTGTRQNAEDLGRVTGLQHVPTTVPRRLGEILREPVLLAAAGGGVLSLLWLRARALPGLALGIASLLAFSVLATAGLPILGRYLLLPAAVLTIFAAAGLLGWLALAHDDPHRRPWQAFAALCVLVLLVFLPSTVDRVRGERHALARQNTIQDDLRSLVADRPPCSGPLVVPNRRPIPLLALWLDRSPGAVRTGDDGYPPVALALQPASPQVASDYILDARDRDRTVPAPPSSYIDIAGNRSWRLLTRGCPTDPEITIIR